MEERDREIIPTATVAEVTEAGAAAAVLLSASSTILLAQLSKIW